MLRLRDASLSKNTQRRLDEYQRNIKAITDYTQKIDAAKNEFTAKNRENNSAFREVRRVLASLCTGTLRCMYCEDSQPNQIEHIKPKSLYPDLVFVWENYLYACSPCNLGKSNRFHVYSQQTGQKINLARSPKAPVVPPEAGEPLLINPRTEDPLHFMELDIRATFNFRPAANLTSIQQERAEYTIDVLGLNSRENLQTSREHAYEHYILILELYVNNKQAGKSTEELARFQRSVSRTNHATVWAEMKRQYTLIPGLQVLFMEAPEALNW